MGRRTSRIGLVLIGRYTGLGLPSHGGPAVHILACFPISLSPILSRLSRGMSQVLPRHLLVEVANAQRRLADVAVIGARRTEPLLCKQVSRPPTALPLQATVLSLKAAFAKVVTRSPML